MNYTVISELWDTKLRSGHKWHGYEENVQHQICTPTWPCFDYIAQFYCIPFRSSHDPIVPTVRLFAVIATSTYPTRLTCVIPVLTAHPLHAPCSMLNAQCSNTRAHSFHATPLTSHILYCFIYIPLRSASSNNPVNPPRTTQRMYWAMASCCSGGSLWVMKPSIAPPCRRLASTMYCLTHVVTF